MLIAVLVLIVLMLGFNILAEMATFSYTKQMFDLLEGRVKKLNAERKVNYH